VAEAAVKAEESMRAIVFDAGSAWSVEDVAKPIPRSGEALLRPLLTGMCGTDEHLLHGGFIAQFPLIPGHEIVAEVVSYGPDTNGPELGSKVVVDPATFCGACNACRRGEPGHCENFGSLGCDRPGGYAEYLTAGIEKLFPIGDLDPTVAVLTEPLACAMHGVDVLALQPASNVLIFGAGPTGLLLAQLVRLGGAARVTVAAPTASKLEIALRHGADHVVQLDRANTNSAKQELRQIAPDGFDAVIEATGSTSVLELGIDMTRTGGQVLVYGLADADAAAAIKPYEIFSRELTIKGSFAQANCVGRALSALQTGRIDTAGIITTMIGLDQFETALHNLHDSEQIKTIVTPGRAD
jgi:D-arabinitol dehydrogenase (NADP+)